MAGKVSTIHKSVYCASNGRLVTYFRTPKEYYSVQTLKGQTKIYLPSTNQVYTDKKDIADARDELLYLFLSGRVADLGLMQYGYRSESTSTEEGGLLKKTFVSNTDGNIPKVELVFQNYLPIYAAYISAEGRTVGKLYLSRYQTQGRFTFPSRTTQINYLSDKDSTVVRTVYSNLKVDVDDPMFDFEVPSDARAADLSTPKSRRK